MAHLASIWEICRDLSMILGSLRVLESLFYPSETWTRGDAVQTFGEVKGRRCDEASSR
ncbi:hypothetical protein AN958_00160 [Leucoagaricus sp. SymC.cos]|nr:hypothetical protein AN958_00160 [Leucoagaricus sp. SymC.cos]